MLPMLSSSVPKTEDSNITVAMVHQSVAMIQRELWWFFYLRKNSSEGTPALC